MSAHVRGLDISIPASISCACPAGISRQVHTHIQRVVGRCIGVVQAAISLPELQGRGAGQSSSRPIGSILGRNNLHMRLIEKRLSRATTPLRLDHDAGVRATSIRCYVMSRLLRPDEMSMPSTGRCRSYALAVHIRKLHLTNPR